jgi:uncharacterized protein (TIGR02145 family)
VTFTATPFNGGTTPAYQWKLNGIAIDGATNAAYTFIPADGNAITCDLSSDETCTSGNPANSNTVTMTVNPLLPVTVSIDASANPVCAGVSVTYTATGVNGGSTPAYQWLVNGAVISGATSATYSYIPVNNDEITCVLTSNALCTAGNPATGIPVISISSTPVVTYSACHDIVTATNAKPFRLRGGLPLGGIYSGAGVNSITAIFDPFSAGPGTHIITYTYTSSGLCTASGSLSIINHDSAIVNCGLSIKDIRDDQDYPTVQIGTQCWMAGNLNFGTISNSSDPQIDNCMNEKYCLNNIESNCTLYGGLYSWDELMKYEPVAGGQGLCPPGWHVPTEAEWLTLFNFYSGQSVASASLKDMGTGSFRALPGGVLYENHSWSFYPPDFAATFFWTSEASGPMHAKSHGLNTMVNSVSDYRSGRDNGFSVRCLLDHSGL